MKKVINFLKMELRKGRYLFFSMLLIMTLNFHRLVSVGWGGWTLYLTMLAASIISNSLAGGISIKEIILIIRAIHGRK